MVASKVLNGHLKTIRSIVVKSFAKIDKRFDTLDERIVGIERVLNVPVKKEIEETRVPPDKVKTEA